MKTTPLKIKKMFDFTAVIVFNDDGCEWQVFNPKNKMIASGFGKNSKNAIDSARRKIKNEINT